MKSTASRRELILQVVCEHYRVERDLLFNKTRVYRITRTRQIAMHLMRELLHMSFPEIGLVFDAHHSTVMHANFIVKVLCAQKQEFAEQLKIVQTECEQKLATKRNKKFALLGEPAQDVS